MGECNRDVKTILIRENHEDELIWLKLEQPFRIAVTDPCAEKRRQGEASARSYVEVVMKIIGDASLQMFRAQLQNAIGPGQRERNRYLLPCEWFGSLYMKGMAGVCCPPGS